MASRFLRCNSSNRACKFRLILQQNLSTVCTIINNGDVLSTIRIGGRRCLKSDFGTLRAVARDVVVASKPFWGRGNHGLDSSSHSNDDSGGDRCVLPWES